MPGKSMRYPLCTIFCVPPQPPALLLVMYPKTNRGWASAESKTRGVVERHLLLCERKYELGHTSR